MDLQLAVQIQQWQRPLDSCATCPEEHQKCLSAKQPASLRAALPCLTLPVLFPRVSGTTEVWISDPRQLLQILMVLVGFTFLADSLKIGRGQTIRPLEHWFWYFLIRMNDRFWSISQSTQFQLIPTWRVLQCHLCQHHRRRASTHSAARFRQPEVRFFKPFIGT